MNILEYIKYLHVGADKSEKRSIFGLLYRMRWNVLLPIISSYEPTSEKHRHLITKLLPSMRGSDKYINFFYWFVDGVLHHIEQKGNHIANYQIDSVANYVNVL